MMTPGAAAVIDDDALSDLARGPQRPLFPLLRHAEAMVPLVVVLAFLPTLYAAQNRTLSDAGARAGLVGVHLLTAPGLTSLVDQGALDRPYAPDHEPPLINWLTALGMFAFGTGTAAGFIAPAYLATAGLVLACYILARRMGGERLGLVTAALVAFNPHLLAGAQEPLPQSPGVMLAVLSMAGVIAHWQKSSTITSYQLLLGGVALGGCLLAGGPVALAVITGLVIYILLWKLDARLVNREDLVRERSQLHRRTAVRALGIMMATGFAVGGWYLLLMSSRHGRDFWQAWLAPPATGSNWPESTMAGISLRECIGRLNRLALPLLGFALLGFIGIARDWYRGEEDSPKRFRGLLAVWTVTALGAWIWTGSAAHSGASDAGLWETWLAIPIVIAAAVGLIEIVERRVPFPAAVAVALLTFADVVLLAGPVLFAPQTEGAPGRWSGRSPGWWDAGLLVVLVGCGIALLRYAGDRDGRRRTVLTGLLLAVIAVNSAWGALAVRRTNQGDRELEAVQAALARLPGVTTCTFVSLSPSEGDREDALPPAQLTFLLARLWATAETRFATSWDQAVSLPAVAPARDAPGPAAFVAWSPRGHVRGSPPAAGFKTIAPPFHFRDVEIILYTRDLSAGSRGVVE